MPSFQQALSSTPLSEGESFGEIQEDWRQGRAAYGGLVAAQALKAMQAKVAPDRPTRALQVVFVAPLDQGPITAQATVLRAGRSMTLAQATLFQGDRVLLTASGAFGADRDSDIQVLPSAPAPIKEPEACMALPFLPGVTPNFTQHFDYRWADGGFPFSGSQEARFKGWCRHKAPVPDSAQQIVGLADAWPAPTLALAKRPIPASSVTWNLQFLHLPQDPGTGWWRMDYDTDHAQAGVHSITGQLYAPDGQLAALSTQLAVVFDKR